MIYRMDRKTFIDSIFQSMQDSAREVRYSLGRPSSYATRDEALRQVAMLQAAKDAFFNAGIDADLLVIE